MYKLSDDEEKREEPNAIAYSLANTTFNIRINENDRNCLSINLEKRDISFFSPLTMSIGEN